MTSFTYAINDEQGIHARPAGQLVKITKSYACDIKIGKDGKVVDAKKLLGIMGLGAKKGHTVEFTFDGADEAEAAAAVEEFMKANL